MNSRHLWHHYQDSLCGVEALGLSLDISRMRCDDGFFRRMAEPMERAFQAMDALEQGGIANPDEQRRVGHYWLRAPELAPEPGITRAILVVQEQIRAFAAEVHTGRLRPVREKHFRHVLVIGIGGSALGPQLVADALGGVNDPLAVHFFDNTDPDGMARTLARLAGGLASTLTLVISKSGGTTETRNGMRIAAKAYQDIGLPFARHAVAITGADSALDRTARTDGWLARFPMWDWVGGRTSVLSVVGLLPAALQGFGIDEILGGARDMDVATRRRTVRDNPAALLALMWYHAGGGRGLKDMVILPYRDRLLLFSRYLQQLVMESLGKERDLSGATVHQGIAVYGNKGSTDQHAYVQQLRDGVANFFVTFIQVLQDQTGSPLEVEPDITSGDYLLGFLLGTRDALFQNDRESMTITVPDVSGRTLGGLIALYERAVGFYASLIGINAYHQPGVEAGKAAASAVIALQRAVLDALRRAPGVARTADEWATATHAADQAEVIHKVLEHLAANGRVLRTPGGPAVARYSLPQIR